jgi:hypothetical protein
VNTDTSGYNLDFSISGDTLYLTDGDGTLFVDLSSIAPTGLNGIYGDGSAGTGSDTLPPGGSTVTIPGQWQPLEFEMDVSSAQVWTAIRVSADQCADDLFSKYFVGRSPSDSLEIYGYDCGTVIKETGGVLTLETDKEMYLIADSFNMATVPQRTIAAHIMGQDAGGWVRRIQGASTGQILKWNGTNWALADDNAGTGTLDGAENGLNVVANKARLGGTLLLQTTIAQAGFGLFHNNGKWSHSTNTAFTFTPAQGFGVMGTEGNPTVNSSPTLDGIAEFRAHLANSEQPNSLTIGAYTNDNQGTWMQSRSYIVPNFHYPLQLNPRGGPVSVGRGTSIPNSTLTVTATGITGSAASGRVLLLENVEGATVGAAFGTGGDNIGAELTWRSADNAFRITNRSTTTNARVTVSVGGAPEAGDTNDRAHFISTSAASKVRAGFGTTVANTHSTVQSAGSIAAPVTQSSAGTLTLNETHYRVIHTTNSTPSWTLPAANTCAGREYIIHHFGSSGQIGLNENVVSSTGTTFNNVPARHWAYIFSDGSSWRGYRLESL